MQTLIKGMQAACRNIEGLFQAFSEKLRPQHNETILSFQYCKLSRQGKEIAEEWMGRLRMNAAGGKYKENDRHWKEYS